MSATQTNVNPLNLKYNAKIPNTQNSVRLDGALLKSISGQEERRKRADSVSSTGSQASTASNLTQRPATPQQNLKVYRGFERGLETNNGPIHEEKLYDLVFLWTILSSVCKGILQWITTCFRCVLWGFYPLIQGLLTCLKMVATGFLISLGRFIDWKTRYFPARKNPFHDQTGDFNRMSLRKLHRILEQSLIRKNLTLVLDLDETLIHSSKTKPEKGKYETIAICKADGSYDVVYMQERPHLDFFLEQMGQKFNLVIFTSSTESYAQPIISHIDKFNIVRRILYRDSCEKADNGKHIKDLRKVTKDLRKVVMIDNSEVASSKNPENAITIKPWYSDEKDQELLKVMKILQRICNDEIDVRNVTKQHKLK